MKEKIKKNDARTFDKFFFVVLAIFMLLIYLSIFYLPKLIVDNSLFSVDLTGKEQIGNSFGSLVGTFVAMVAAFLTFIAFWVQYKANKQQWDSIQIDRLENRIYEMLNLHKQNVLELKYLNKQGRDVFKRLFLEFRYIYLVLEEFANHNHISKLSNDKEKMTSIAYLIFFIGIEEQNNYLKNLISQEFNDILFDNLISYFLKFKDNALFITTFNINVDEGSDNITSLRLENHGQRLGHYFRHLYQMIKYIDQYSNNILPSEDKYQYTKTIRAQLSNYEQLLLYYNALSKFGQAWIDDNFLIKYKLIKNIPLPLADFGLRPQEKFQKEIKELIKYKDHLFEWSE